MNGNALTKMNPIQAIGSLIALVLYILTPVVAISILVIGYGVSGNICMKLDGLFVVPLVFIVITMIVSLLPIGKISSAAGIVTTIVMLIVGLCIKDVVSGKLDTLALLAGIDLGSYAGVAKAAASMLLNMGWGLIASMAIMLISAIAGLFIGSSNGGANVNHTNRTSHTGSGTGRTSAYGSQSTSKLYRR